jgi:hypothetical protein
MLSEVMPPAKQSTPPAATQYRAHVGCYLGK